MAFKIQKSFTHGNAIGKLLIIMINQLNFVIILIFFLLSLNSLPLRFWVNLLKNPNFLFDLEKTPILDCNLNVIAQAFLDSCSFDHQILNKESHSAKLLFAREIPKYREMVKKYYEDIRCLPKIRKDQMWTELKNCSKVRMRNF